MFHISQLLLYSNKYAVKTLIMFINSFPGAQTGQRSRRMALSMANLTEERIIIGELL